MPLTSKEELRQKLDVLFSYNTGKVLECIDLIATHDKELLAEVRPRDVEIPDAWETDHQQGYNEALADYDTKVKQYLEQHHDRQASR